MSRHRTTALALILCIQALGVFYYLWFLTQHGYLPIFTQNKFDSLMDFFNTLSWSDNDGRYTVGKSYYPPLNYIFLKLVKLTFLRGANISDPFLLRASSFPVVLFILISFLLAPILVLRTKVWNSFTGAEKTLLYFIIILSTPMLFALERGNLILYTLPFIAFALSSSGLFRAISIAVLINLKPYLALLLFYYLVRRNWKDFWLCTFLSGMLLVIPGILLDRNFLLFFGNMFSWSQKDAILSAKEVMAMPSSISAFSYVFNHEAIQHATKYSYFFNLHAIANLISAINWFVIAWVFVSLYKKSNRLTDTQIFAILLVAITNLGIWIGGYSLIFYITLLPVFLTMGLRSAYCVILMLMIAPLDFIPLAKETIGEQYSYLTDAIVEVHWTLGMGSVLKPILNFILMVTLLYEISQLPQQNEATKRFYGSSQAFRKSSGIKFRFVGVHRPGNAGKSPCQDDKSRGTGQALRPVMLIDWPPGLRLDSGQGCQVE